MKNGNNFLIKALEKRRKYITNSNDNNDGPNLKTPNKSPSFKNTLRRQKNNTVHIRNKQHDAATKIQSKWKQYKEKPRMYSNRKKSVRATNDGGRNAQELFGLMGEEFLKMATNNAFLKNQTLADQERTIDILLIKLKLAKGLLRKLKTRTDKSEPLMISERFKNKNETHRKSQRIKKLKRNNNFVYY